MRLHTATLCIAYAVITLASCGGGGGGGPAQPETSNGSVRGIVTDQAAAAVADATVTLTGAGQTPRVTTTGSDGGYSFTGLAAGAYTVTAAPPAGFTVGASGSASVVVVAGQQANASTIVLNKTTAGPAPSQVNVTLQYSAFVPRSVTVVRNGSVRWVNNDDFTHNVTGAGLTVGTLTAGQQRSQVFATAGTFNYECTIHSGMTGTVVVQ